MMRTLGLLLLLVAAVQAQILFPGEKPEGAAPPPDEGAKASDNELFDALDITNRQNINFNDVSGSSCVVPGGESGTCLAFSACSQYARLRNQLHSPSVLSFLRQRICRRFRNTVHLCCPSSNPTSTRPQPSTSLAQLQRQCGTQPLDSVRVVGGVETVPGEFPWLAALGSKVGNTFREVCGGTLITQRHVLTAGHCFTPGTPHPTTVRLGEYNLRRTDDTLTPPQEFNIVDRRDRGYNTRTQENDISIVILDRDAVFNDYVQPACLPYNYRNDDFVGQELLVTGWGRLQFTNVQTPDVPIKALVPVKSKQSCISDYNKLPSDRRPVVDTRTMCAGNGITDSCRGDSGGPLLHLDFTNTGRYTVVGIVSFGVGCGRPDFPGVYTRVASFLDWIESNVQ